jgi:hypothetical protein
MPSEKKIPLEDVMRLLIESKEYRTATKYIILLFSVFALAVKAYLN